MTTYHNWLYCSFTSVSQLKICDFSGESFKGFEVLYFSVSATTQLLSSGEFCKLLYDPLHVKSASANVSFLERRANMDQEQDANQPKDMDEHETLHGGV